MRLTHDPDADAAYVYLSAEPVTRTYCLDEARNLDLDAQGALCGIEFLWVSSGVTLAGLPVQRAALYDLLVNRGILIRDPIWTFSGTAAGGTNLTFNLSRGSWTAS